VLLKSYLLTYLNNAITMCRYILPPPADTSAAGNFCHLRLVSKTKSQCYFSYGFQFLFLFQLVILH